MSSLKPSGPSANAPARLRALQASRITDPNTRQAIEALQEWVEVRLGSRGDPYERAVTWREYSKDNLELTRRLVAIEASLDKLLRDNVDAIANGAVTAGDLAGIQDALRVLNFELSRLRSDTPAGGVIASGTGYAKLASGKMSALSLIDTRLELQGDGTIAEAVGFRGWPVLSKSTNYTVVPADAGWLILHPAADAASRVFTISTAFTVGAVLGFANETSQALNLTSSDALVLVGGTAGGDIGLPRNSIALAWKVATGKWLVWGANLANAATGAAAGVATVTGVGVAITGDARHLDRLLVLEAEGTNGSDPVDTGKNAMTITQNDGAVVDTSTSKIGSGSIVFDGVNNYLLQNTTANGSEYELQGQWEIELYYKPTATPPLGTGSSSLQMLYCRRKFSDAQRVFLAYGYFSGVQSNPGLWFQIDRTSGGGGSVSVIRDVTLSTSVFTHIKVTYDGSAYRIFVDGVLQGSAATSSVKHPDSSDIDNLHIGYGWSSSFWAYGYMDHYVITKNAPVSTADFTPPTTALAGYIGIGVVGSAAGTSTAAATAAHSGLAAGLSFAVAVGVAA